MEVVVDLNILRADKFQNDKYIIPILLILELLNSTSSQEDEKINLLQKIKDRKYEIDKRHPRTFFCEAINEDNRDQKVYDRFIDKLFNSEKIDIKNDIKFISFNKQLANDFDRSFVDHDFSKILDKDLYNKIKKERSEIYDEFENAIIKRIKELLIDKFLQDNKIAYNKFILTKSMDIYYSVMAYYQYFCAKNGRPKRNDFTDINYMLYLDGDRKFYSLDNKINDALRVVNPELLLTPAST